jgi:site-specific DNA-methyltransferase (adenine-specific)/adenine-specific DNA-methyltransferase
MRILAFIRVHWRLENIFENEWQGYRTRKNRALDLTSATHTYEQKG